MKVFTKFLFTVALVAICINLQGVVTTVKPTQSTPQSTFLEKSPTFTQELALLQQLDVATFTAMTPNQVETAIGRKLSFKEKVGLKFVQKKINKELLKMDTLDATTAPDSSDKTLIYVLCFFLPPLAVWMCYENEGNKFIVNLILTLLCGIPGIIHAFIVCSQYFKGK